MTGIEALISDAADEALVSFLVPLGNGKKVRMEGLADPKQLGFDRLSQLQDDPAVFIDIFTKHAWFNWGLAFATPEDMKALFGEWLKVTGLGDLGVFILTEIVKDPVGAEADLQMFYNVDLRDWVAPDGGLTSRRLVVLMQGLKFRPESLFWSAFGEMDPMTRETILLAQQASSEEKKHPILTARQDRKNKAIQDEKTRRMLARGLSAGA